MPGPRKHLVEIIFAFFFLLKDIVFKKQNIVYLYLNFIHMVSHPVACCLTVQSPRIYYRLAGACNGLGTVHIWQPQKKILTLLCPQNIYRVRHLPGYRCFPSCEEWPMFFASGKAHTSVACKLRAKSTKSTKTISIDIPWYPGRWRTMCTCIDCIPLTTSIKSK